MRLTGQRSRRPPLQSRRAEPALGRRPDHVHTWTGFVYVAFITDVHSRMIVGWQASRSLRSDLALDALEQAIWARSRRGQPRLDQLVHHYRQGRSISRHSPHRTARRDQSVNSVSRRSLRYDNALAETIIGLYKAELVRNRGPWRGLDDLEYATLEWIDWFNHHRLFEAHGRCRPPAKFEELHYRQNDSARGAETQTKQPA